MSTELRWALLLLGGVFILLLALWEWRRPRQARGGAGRETLPDGGDGAERMAGDAYALPAIHARERHGDSGAGLVGLSATRHLPVLTPLEPAEATEAADAAADDAQAADEAQAADDVHDTQAAHDAQREVARESAPVGDQELPAEPVAGAEAPDDGTVPTVAPAPATESPVDADAAAAAPATGRAAPPGMPAGTPPIVDWPPEAERRFLSMRIVARQGDRIAGRALRLAFAAEGFVIGPFAIFHKPDEAHRAVLSAASLTRPGSFDLQTMDSQHYAGISLFAVLPGARPAPQVFEDLVYTARALNERLLGVLQDDSGSPLTAARIGQLREQLRAGANS